MENKGKRSWQLETKIARMVRGKMWQLESKADKDMKGKICGRISQKHE